jgi:hypothetical protein
MTPDRVFDMAAFILSSRSTVDYEKFLEIRVTVKEGTKGGGCDPAVTAAVAFKSGRILVSLGVHLKRRLKKLGK